MSCNKEIVMSNYKIISRYSSNILAFMDLAIKKQTKKEIQ